MKKIRLTIRDACEARGITSGYQLMDALDIHPTSAYRLFNSEARVIHLDQLERLVNVLGCDLSELIAAEEAGAEAKKPSKKTSGRTDV